jgi:lauroyl/myristoyl acyltransferase
MADMSSYQFQYTSLELNDCVRALQKLVDDPATERPSEDEADAAKYMRRLCERFIEAYDEWQQSEREEE